MAVNRFLFPRAITIRRPGTNPAPGRQGYSGNVRTDETDVATDIPASIQASTSFRASGGEILPSGAPGPGRWRIFVPKGQLTKGQVQNDDVVVDDESARYLVADAYWTPLGYTLNCIRMRLG